MQTENIFASKLVTDAIARFCLSDLTCPIWNDRSAQHPSFSPFSENSYFSWCTREFVLPNNQIVYSWVDKPTGSWVHSQYSDETRIDLKLRCSFSYFWRILNVIHYLSDSYTQIRRTDCVIIKKSWTRIISSNPKMCSWRWPRLLEIMFQFIYKVYAYILNSASFSECLLVSNHPGMCAFPPVAIVLTEWWSLHAISRLDRTVSRDTRRSITSAQSIASIYYEIGSRAETNKCVDRSFVSPHQLSFPND